MTAVKKKKTAEQKSVEVTSHTKQSRRAGSNIRNDSKLYSKQQFIKDYREQEAEKDIIEKGVSLKKRTKSEISRANRSNPNHMATSIQSFSDSLIKYAQNKKHRDISGFFKLFSISPSVYYKMVEEHEDMSEAHSFAIACFSYNNLMLLDDKTLTSASQDASKMLHKFYSPEIRRRRREDMKFESHIRAIAMDDLIEIKKQLLEKQGSITVKVEY